MSRTTAINQAPSSNFSPTDEERRRIFIKAYFTFNCQWYGSKWQQICEGATEDLCTMLARKGYTQVSQRHFDYIAESFTWYDYVKEVGWLR
ncbi:hypothetical protein FSHL1_010448 [Fusarium sambucinum]